MIDNKKVLFSGMQATGNLTLGNYLGALKNFAFFTVLFLYEFVLDIYKKFFNFTLQIKPKNLNFGV